MTVGELLEKSADRLDEKGVPEARANAEFLMAAVLQAKRGAVLAQPLRALNPKQEHQFWHLTLERAKRIPLAYVLGTQEFMGMELKVTPSVLIPRPETEQLVEAAAAAARGLAPAGRRLHVLDIGTGSGCVSVALAHLIPEAMVIATDISDPALKLAEENARRHHLGTRIRFIHGDLFHPDRGTSRWADVVVSNPPYIPSREVDKLAPEVLKEPRLALDGGPDGLEALRAVVQQAPGLLKAGGWLALEIGAPQGAAVRKLMAQAGLSDVEIRKDLQGLDRIALGRRLA